MSEIIESISDSVDSGWACIPDGALLDEYGERMVEEGISWRVRRVRIDTAGHFLRWLRSRYPVNAKIDSAFIGDNDAMKIELREIYLRIACPMRDLRSIERTHLNHFLHYLSSIRQNSTACKRPGQ